MAKKRKLKKSASTFLILCLLVIGAGIMLYPSFSDWYNQRHQSQVIVNYDTTVNENEAETNRQMWEEARNYNAEIAEKGVNFVLNDEEKERYNSILDVTGTGVMGYIKIDKIHVNLPLYHDTSDGVLQIAVGHLAGSSLPVGGNSSHSVLTGHTGLPSARLFTDIDQLEKGDTFEIVVLNHTLTYEVYDIRTVLPDELDSLQIEEGKDLCTLVTCTPYGINTHRLLVTGYRIPNKPPVSSLHEANGANTRLRVLGILALSLTAAILILLIIMLVRRIKENAYRK